jgi:hypothetical protein
LPADLKPLLLRVD